MTVEFQYTEPLDPIGAVLSGLPVTPDNKWYFWDETWTEAYGPYESKEEASTGAKKYAAEVLG